MWNPFAHRSTVVIEMTHQRIELTTEDYYVGDSPDDLKVEHRIVDIRTIDPPAPVTHLAHERQLRLPS